MADRVSASLKVGGRLTSSALPELIELIQQEGVGPDWGESFQTEGDLLAHFRNGASGVTFYAFQVRNGEFEDLQDFCARHGLTYVLSFDGLGGGWAPGRRIRRPQDRGQGLTCTLDGDRGAACLSADQIPALGLTTVQEILAHLERFNLSETPPFVIDDAPAASVEAAP